jgi:hypothetical protein
LQEEIEIIQFTKSGLPERAYKTLCTNPDPEVEKEFSGHVPITFNEQVNLLDEIILRVLHAAFEKIGPFLEKISSLSQEIFESPHSTSLIRMKCAEMKGTF